MEMICLWFETDSILAELISSGSVFQTFYVRVMSLERRLSSFRFQRPLIKIKIEKIHQSVSKGSKLRFYFRFLKTGLHVLQLERTWRASLFEVNWNENNVNK